MDVPPLAAVLRRRRARGAASRFATGVRPQAVDRDAGVELVLGEDAAGRLVLLDPWHAACGSPDAAADLLLLGTARLADRHLRPATLALLRERGRAAVDGTDACNALLAYAAVHGAG